ncbi:MAG TPA: MlaD family protein [Burkholderiales bacterium]|nr:MlaD family protein [Burkholderiales bacterium]
MDNRAYAFAAGLFVILLTATAIGGAVWLRRDRQDYSAGYELVTKHSVTGLSAGAPVRFRGVDVGRVQSIKFDREVPGQIKVRIAVDRDAPITRGTFGRLSYQGLGGVAFVQLDDDGKDPRPVDASAGAMAQMELQPSFFESTEDTAQQLLARMDRVAGRLEVFLGDDNQRLFLSTLSSFEKTSDQYRVLAQELQPSAKALPQLVASATRTMQQGESTLRELETVSVSVNQRLDGLDSVSSAARQLERAAHDFSGQTLPRLNAFIDEATGDARELRQTLVQIQEQPQSLMFGPRAPPPGPGEAGFTVKARMRK